MTQTRIPHNMLDQTGDVIVPIGTILDYAGTNAPNGWLLCAGQAVSRTTFAALFAVISTTYGAGDGSTTFNVPDLRGRVAAGKDDMGGTAANRITSGGAGITGTSLGANGGSETHTLTAAQIPAHSHPLSAPFNTTTAGGAATFTAAANVNASGSSTSLSTANNTGGGSAHNNTQPTIILNKIIRT